MHVPHTHYPGLEKGRSHNMHPLSYCEPSFYPKCIDNRGALVC